MKKIIDGRMYNTETATWIGENSGIYLTDILESSMDVLDDLRDED